MIEVYTDGYCDPNPGLGGWGWYCPTLGTERNGGEYDTTNNRMEIEAIRQALIDLDVSDLTVFSDSEYAIGVISKNWKVKANRDLVFETRKLATRPGRKVSFVWVRGHVGNSGNERADLFAKQGSLKVSRKGGRSQ